MEAHAGEQKFGIDELATLSGVTRRTVRYYVQRGLLQPPTGTGRGQHYTKEHLQALLQIRTLQEQGVSLEEIARNLGHAPPERIPAATLESSDWLRFVLADGIELQIRNRPPAAMPVRRVVEVLSNALLLEGN